VAKSRTALWRFLELVPLHPVFVVANLVLLFASGEISSIEISTLLWTAAFLLIGTAILIGALTPLAGGINRAAIAVTIILILAIPLPAVIGTPAGMASITRIALLILVPAAGIALVFGLRRVAGWAPFLTFIFNLVTFALLAQSLIQPVSQAIDFAGHRPAPGALYPDIAAAAPAGNSAPDVWHIVMDRYAGAETLQRVYGFDNTAFLDALEQRGFSVARAAAANYQRTAASLTSTLNLDYLTPFEDRVEGADQMPLYRALKDNRVARFFAAQGYALVHAGPWWEPTRHNAHETIDLGYADLPELARVMVERSLLGHFAVATGMEFGNGRLTQCRRISAQFDRLEATAGSAERKFVFAHMLLPHPPYVVDAEGNCKSSLASSRQSREQNYLDQLHYANRRLLALIDRIQAGPRPAVILLQADEGPWPGQFAGNELDIGMDAIEVDWSELDRNQIREKMQILYALRYPDPPAASLAPNASPVNAYRMILNRYFGMAYPILPDRFYLFRDRRHLYDFIDVGEALR